MTDTTIRIARPREHARALQAYEAWGYGGGVQPDDGVYLAERGGEVVGIVRRTREHGVAMLRGMQVAPEWRGRGTGRVLRRALVADLGADECFCAPCTHLTGFYGAAGFAEISEENTPPFPRDRLAACRTRGLDVLVMRTAGGAAAA